MSDELDDEFSGRIERAIADVLTDAGENGLLVDWVVVTHQIQPGGPGEGDVVSTGYFSSEYQPRYRTLGLLDYGRTSVMKEIHDDMGDDR